MPRRRLNRREALGLGAAALAAGTLRPRPALASPAAHSALFELPVQEPTGARAAGGWRTLEPLRAPRRFDLVGLGWKRGAVEAQVRARRAGGSWSRWVALHALAAHGPDGEASPRGTEPAWTGAADLVQLRLRGRAEGLRARFVRAAPSAAVARRLHARARARSAQVAPAPPIIPRAAWGGDLVAPRAPAGLGTVQLAFVHHTGPPARDYGPGDSAAMVLAFARYHRDANGWNDLGYNFLVDRYGQVFEGRAGGIDQPVVGAQAQGFNSVSTGIACIGDFSAVAQTEPGLDALARLIAWKLGLHGVPVEGQVVVTSGGGESSRYPAGAQVTFERIAAHRDANRTSCPGEGLFAQLGTLRARVAALVPRAVAALELEVATPRVRGTRPAEVAGVLRFADGSSPAGAPLGVEFQPTGGAWQPVGATTAGPDGSWRAGVALPSSGVVRAVFPGDPARPRLESSAASVTVLPALTMALSAPRVGVGRRAVVSGTLVPTATPVVCLLERRVGNRWITSQRKRIAVAGGRYRTTVRPRRAGLYRVSILGPGVTSRRRLRAGEISGGVSP